jgi:uncharacterized membrane protein YeaQ/YmgE (transglycosylase-associated protein family)
MGILTWILVGLVAGIIAKFIMPGRDPGGIIVTILIGIAGGMLGGFIASQLNLGTMTGFDIRSLIIAVLGSLLLLFVYRRVRR